MEKTEVRIVAGSLRGRKIQVGVHPGLRPTPQMVREALFSILGNAVPGRPFYDVFAGTGVVGLEAVSRGATEARLIESDAKQAAEIRKYAERFGVADRAQVLATSWGQCEPDQLAVNGSGAPEHRVACLRAPEIKDGMIGDEPVYPVPSIAEAALAAVPREQRPTVLELSGVSKTFPLLKGALLKRRDGAG